MVYTGVVPKRDDSTTTAEKTASLEANAILHGGKHIKTLERHLRRLRKAYDHGNRKLFYDDLVIAGFSFTPEAQTIIDEKPNPRLRIHNANIRHR